MTLLLLLRFLHNRSAATKYLLGTTLLLGITFVFQIVPIRALKPLGGNPSAFSQKRQWTESTAESVLFTSSTSSLPSSRRQWLQSASITTVTTTTATVVAAAGVGTMGSLVVWPIQPAVAARGAAELDLEFYMRDLVGGNKREGSILPSNAPPIAPSRTLAGPLIALLLDKDCSPSCVPVQALIEQIQQRPRQDGSKVDRVAVANDIQRRVETIREKTKRSFASKAPWKTEEVTDQYYFDLTAYALWKTAAELLGDNLDRDKFVRNMGRKLVERLKQEGLLKKSNGGTTLVGSTPAVLELLAVFKSSGFIKDFRIRTFDDPGAPPPQSGVIFDVLDDESILMGGTADCLVSVYEPATLGASLQINGEQSRFGPDVVGPCLAALWENSGVKSSWETYFVDPEYRPNPKDYFPNEQLLQFTLSKK
jgi:hypothetical protein